jgi:hypothetical protein
MRIAAAAVIVACTAINCSVASERALLDQFFAASRLRDRTALARFSTVVFEPLTDGIVEEFVVLSATPERQIDESQPSDRMTGGAGERQRIINLSLIDPIDPIDPRQHQTVFLEKDVTVSARLALADGTDATRSIVLRLQRARVEHDRVRTGRWIVVRFMY